MEVVLPKQNCCKNSLQMCNRIKSAKQIRCAKTVYWDLINSNMNKRDVAIFCGYFHGEKYYV